MKTNRTTFAVSVAIALMLIGTQWAAAQQPKPAQPRQTNPANANQVAEDVAGKNLSKLDDKTSGATIRASQLLGANIKNSKGEDVGEIKDLVIDSTGRIRYAAVTYGGFLGVGSELFAVPYEAFQVRRNPNDPDDADDYVLTLDVTKEQMDGATGFNTDSWPNFADTKFTQDLDRRYKIDRSRMRSRGGVDVDVNKRSPKQRP